MPTHAPALLTAYAFVGVILFLATDSPARAEMVQREARGGQEPSLTARVALLVALVLLTPVAQVVRLWRSS